MVRVRVGNRGLLILPRKLRKRFGIEEGRIVKFSEREGEILIQPLAATPVSSKHGSAFGLRKSSGADPSGPTHALKKARARFTGWSG